jgi:hypothetical protein
MTEVIHEHHEESAVSLLVIVLIIIVGVGGYLLWRYLPTTSNQNTTQPDVNVNVTLPPGNPTSPSTP